MISIPANIDRSNPQSLTDMPKQKNRADCASKRHLSDSVTHGVPVSQMSLAKRSCRPSVSGQAVDPAPNRKQLGGKGMFLQRMKEADLSVPPFQCVTTQVMNALEQHPLDIQGLEHYFSGIGVEPEAEISLVNIRERLNALPPSEQAKRDSWLTGVAKFIASEDFYKQVKDSEAARHIRDHGLLTSQPLIVRSSGINEDNYGDAEAGKYLSLVQEEDDILRTCLRVMASGYRPEVCPGVIPPPMALIIQQCIDCRYGGVAMSFQSFQDNTVRIEYTPGQPRGVVVGQSGNTPHRIDIYREGRTEEAGSSQYFPGTISSHFILHKNNNGYSETSIDDADAQSNDVEQQLSDDMVSELRRVVTELENLLLCPVDVEFAIDHQGRLFLLQVRPVTRLSGGMDFAMSIPEDSLATGEGASEGFCTGPLWLANKRDSGAMPEGAIVVAHHAEEWMLEPECLNRAGGVVFAEGGFNDHVAILLRQKKIPLMLVGGEYAAVVAQNGQPVTLACARFKDKPGAFVVAGDITENLDSYRSLSSAVSDVSSVKAIPLRDDLSPSEGAFSRVTSGFQWLTDQNARLLAFFAPGCGLDCLANPIKLSMSPQRSKLLAETGESVSRLIHGAEAMLKGYQSFLLLADNSGSFQHKSLLNEVPQLNNRFGALKKTIQSRVEAVVHPMQASEEGQVFPFRQWLAECHQLQSSLQTLHSRKAEQCQSVHDLIFALHQRFVAALAPVALASGQGRISKERYITYVDCTSPGEEAPLLRASDKASMKKLGLSGTVVSMDDALIVNLKLGSHVGLVELLEHADGGKERTLRLRFSDQFEEPDGVDEDGKLKRMWFLVQSLKAIGLDENSDSMKLGCNAVAGEITVECPRMKSRNNMQGAFEKLIIVLDEMYNLDSLFECRAIFEGDQWDFNLLAQRLNGNVATEAERFAFQHCLFLVFCRRVSSSSDAFCQLLSDHYQRFIHHGQCLRACLRHVFIKEKPKDSLREMLMSDEISEDMRRELLQHLLLLYPDEATLLVEDVYPDFRDQYFVISPSMDYKLKFAVPPFDLPPYNLRPTHWLAEHKEKLKKALLKHGLKYGSQRVRECHSSFTDRLGNLRITSNLF